MNRRLSKCVCGFFVSKMGMKLKRVFFIDDFCRYCYNIGWSGGYSILWSEARKRRFFFFIFEACFMFNCGSNAVFTFFCWTVKMFALYGALRVQSDCINVCLCLLDAGYRF